MPCQRGYSLSHVGKATHVAMAPHASIVYDGINSPGRENIPAPCSLICVVRNGRETRLCSPILMVDHIRILGLIIYPQSATMGRCTRVIASPSSGCGREIAISQSWPNPRPRNCFGPHQSLHPSTPLLNYQWNKLSSSKNSKNNESPNQRFRLKKKSA
jgi:hypothetical protein